MAEIGNSDLKKEEKFLKAPLGIKISFKAPQPRTGARTAAWGTSLGGFLKIPLGIVGIQNWEPVRGNIDQANCFDVFGRTPVLIPAFHRAQFSIRNRPC